MSETVPIVFEEHRSKGVASTIFRFNPEPLTSEIFVGGGTHRKYLVTVRKGTVITIIRTSNRGNVHVKKITVDSPMFIDFLGNVQPLDQRYIEFAKVENTEDVEDLENI